jgi:ankyrin repeat protein
MSILDVFWSLPDDIKLMILLNLKIEEYRKLCSSMGSKAVCNINDSFWNLIIMNEYMIDKDAQNKIVRDKKITYADLWFLLPKLTEQEFYKYGILDKYINKLHWITYFLNEMTNNNTFMRKYINAKDIDGKTALLHAISLYVSYQDTKRREMVDKILEAGPDVNLYDDVYRDTPLMLASRISDVELIDKLLENGAYKGINLANDTGGTALMNAVLFGHWKTVKKLLDAGANPDLQNRGKSTALIIATKNNHPDIVETLLKAGANPDIRDDRNKKAIDYADTDEIRALLQEAVDKKFS